LGSEGGVIDGSSGNNTTNNNPSPPWEGYFDCIVTDPPYGIRAGAKKSGQIMPVTNPVAADRRHDHIPRVQRYEVEEVMLDLLHTAARCLVVGGRLSYLIPTPYDFLPSDLPAHPCLSLERICHQGLSSRHGRRAVVMRKYRCYTAEREGEYVTYKAAVLAAKQEQTLELEAEKEAEKEAELEGEVATATAGTPALASAPLSSVPSTPPSPLGDVPSTLQLASYSSDAYGFSDSSQTPAPTTAPISTSASASASATDPRSIWGPTSKQFAQPKSDIP